MHGPSPAEAYRLAIWAWRRLGFCRAANFARCSTEMKNSADDHCEWASLDCS